MPKDDDWVLVAALYEGEWTIREAEYHHPEAGYESYNLPDWWDVQNCEPLEYQGEVTHWMPLPCPPITKGAQ